MEFAFQGTVRVDSTEHKSWSTLRSTQHGFLIKALDVPGQSRAATNTTTLTTALLNADLTCQALFQAVGDNELDISPCCEFFSQNNHTKPVSTHDFFVGRMSKLCDSCACDSADPDRCKLHKSKSLAGVTDAVCGVFFADMPDGFGRLLKTASQVFTATGKLPDAFDRIKCFGPDVFHLRASYVIKALKELIDMDVKPVVLPLDIQEVRQALRLLSMRIEAVSVVDVACGSDLAGWSISWGLMVNDAMQGKALSTTDLMLRFESLRPPEVVPVTVKQEP